MDIYEQDTSSGHAAKPGTETAAADALEAERLQAQQEAAREAARLEEEKHALAQRAEKALKEYGHEHIPADEKPKSHHISRVDARQFLRKSDPAEFPDLETSMSIVKARGSAPVSRKKDADARPGGPKDQRKGQQTSEKEKWKQFLDNREETGEERHR